MSECQNTGNPILDSTVNIARSMNGVFDEGFLEGIHKKLLELAKKEPGRPENREGNPIRSADAWIKRLEQEGLIRVDRLADGNMHVAIQAWNLGEKVNEYNEETRDALLRLAFAVGRLIATYEQTPDNDRAVAREELVNELSADLDRCQEEFVEAHRLSKRDGTPLQLRLDEDKAKQSVYHARHLRQGKRS